MLLRHVNAYLCVCVERTYRCSHHFSIYSLSQSMVTANICPLSIMLTFLGTFWKQSGLRGALMPFITFNSISKLYTEVNSVCTHILSLSVSHTSSFLHSSLENNVGQILLFLHKIQFFLLQMLIKHF